MEKLVMLWKDKSGSALFGFTVFLLVFGLALGIVIEISNAYIVHDNIESGLQQALDTGVQLALSDAYRRDGISHMDTAKAQQETYAYMYEVMGLTAGLSKETGGRTQYRLEHIAISAVAEPARLSMTLDVVVPMTMFQSVLPSPLTLRFPMQLASRNQRLDAV